MKKKILIVSANPYSFCIAVEQHLARINAADSQVDALNLYKLAARHSPYYRRLANRLTVSLNRKFERFLVPQLSGRDITRDIAVDPAQIPPLPTDPAGLRAYELRGAKIGYGVMSSMVSLTTIQHPDEMKEHGADLLSAWRAAHLSLQVGEAVKDLGYDEIYIFNGRHCYARPFCDVLEGTTRLVKYETGGCEDTTTYITSDRSIHEPSAFATIVDEHAMDAAAGEAFYQDRLTRVQGNIATYFTGLQVEGHVPEMLSGKDYVAFFTSSTDERIAAMGEDNLGEFGSQYEVALALARICLAANKTLAIRLHPHLRFKHPSWRREWDFENLRSQGVVVIDPSDACDSYALAQAAHCVVTAGSTVGFECSFLGIANTAVGDCMPARMGASVPSVNEADLARFVASPTLPDDARERAIMFGSYSRQGGIPLPGYELRGHISQARLNGRVLDPVRFLAHPLRRLLHT